MKEIAALEAAKLPEAMGLRGKTLGARDVDTVKRRCEGFFARGIQGVAHSPSMRPDRAHVHCDMTSGNLHSGAQIIARRVAQATPIDAKTQPVKSQSPQAVST